MLFVYVSVWVGPHVIRTRLCVFTDLEGQQKEERPLHRVVALQDFASSLREQDGGVFPFVTPRHALVVVEIVPTQCGAVTRPIAASKTEGNQSEAVH